jgi:hypothetical protein
MIDDPLELATGRDGLLLAEICGDETVRTVEKPIGVTARAFRRVAARRTLQNLLKVKAAVALVDRLPVPGETIHMVVAGDFRTWDLVPAMLAMRPPVPIAELFLATLSYNRDNLAELVDLLDDGRIQSVCLITSVFDRANDPDRFNYAREELTGRGHRLLAMRNHCKLILARFADGSSYVSESSANLRSHSTTEQIALTNDADLYDFHRAWMLEVLDAHSD